jgi:hypothetical protein
VPNLTRSLTQSIVCPAVGGYWDDAIFKGDLSARIQLSGSSVTENSVDGTGVGTLSVTNGSGTYTFSLTDTAGTRFKVAGTNGVNLQAGATATDYEAATSHSITVSATNGVDAPLSRTFSILVLDVDEVAPTITSANSASVQENVVLAHTLTANESVTWSIVGGADQLKFEISGSTLRWASNGTKDYESPDDADTNNAYIVQVRATDGASNVTNQTITVTVTDVGEGGGGVALMADFSDANANEAWVFW